MSTPGGKETPWSKGEIPIRGTVLLELIGVNRIMEGTWQGFTAATLYERLTKKEGRVVIGRDEKVVDEYWGLKPGKKTRTSGGSKGFWRKLGSLIFRWDGGANPNG